MPESNLKVAINAPLQPFTLPGIFAANVNGKIYIGKADSDPTLTQNQIQIYVEKSDGSLIAVLQPLIISAGGNLMYQDQVAKFVTIEDHAIAICDANGVRQFYFPSALKYQSVQSGQYFSAASGATLVGVQPQGNLAQIIQFVSPEQFGAIGDGVVHALSERYATLAAAKAVYPHISSLSQTIDWAACQAAENYARGKCPIRCPYFANYHFGNTDYLALGINSKWYGADNTTIDSGGTTMTRTNSLTTISFGQDAIVRVMEADKAGSSDQFVRGIVFKGFRLTRNAPRRSITKNSARIGMHLYNAIKAEIDIAVSGNEYGLFGYITWGNKIIVRGDSNHKHIWFDAVTKTPEYLPPGGEAVTASTIRLEADAGPFGIILRKAKYVKVSGFIEGALANSKYPNYDYTNETAVAVTLIDCDSINITELGIESWEGIHIYTSGSTSHANLSWTQDAHLLNSTGKHGAYHAMAALSGLNEPAVLPTTNNAYFYAVNGSNLSISNMTADMSLEAGFSDTFLCTTSDKNSRIFFNNTKIYFGQSRLVHPLNGYWLNVEVTNDPFLPNSLIPDSGGYIYLGMGVSTQLDFASTAPGSEGVVTLRPPCGFRILSAEAYLVTSSAAQALNGAITIKEKAADGSYLTFQTAAVTPGCMIYFKLTVKNVR